MLRKSFILISISMIALTGVVFCFFQFSNGQTQYVIDINHFDTQIKPRAKVYSIVKGGYYNLYLYLLDKGYSPHEALNFISDDLGNTIVVYARENSIEPQNARVEFTKDYDKPFIYFEDRQGKRVDLAKLQEDVVKSLDTKESIELNYIMARPEMTLDDLKERTTLRAEFSTNFSISPINRKDNIKKAAQYLNGHIIEPESIMSFNDVVGPRKAERGFKSADIIHQGKMVPGIGGGVCQVSSTMYNTAILAGMDIISASRHSRKVFYLPPSRDAMVSNNTDLIVFNPTTNPLFILTKVDNDNIRISIYGVKTNLRYEIKSEILSLIPPPKDKITINDDNLAPDIREALESNDPEKMKNIAYKDERITDRRAGIESQAYLYIYEDNKLIEKNLISHDMYYPQQGELIRSII